MEGRKIDFETWERKVFIEFYEDYDLPYIIMTADVDVTKALAFAHRNGVSFNLVMVYLANKAADSIENFRYRFSGREIFLINHNMPVINHLVPGTEIFVAASGVWPCDDILEFCRKTHERLSGLPTDSFSNEVSGKTDIINYSAIPWVQFTHMFRTIKGGKDSNPKISFGKYHKENDRTMMPLAVQTHHALMDGYHVGLFYKKIQELIDAIPDEEDEK